MNNLGDSNRAFAGAGGQEADEQSARACLEDYMSGDGERTERAFHPSATMKFIDFQSNEFKDVPIGDFIARVKTNPTTQKRKLSIVALDIEGNAANGKLWIETEEANIYDYMNMLKIDGEWKIVSKIFSKQSK